MGGLEAGNLCLGGFLNNREILEHVGHRPDDEFQDGDVIISRQISERLDIGLEAGVLVIKGLGVFHHDDQGCGRILPHGLLHLRIIEVCSGKIFHVLVGRHELPLRRLRH